MRWRDAMRDNDDMYIQSEQNLVWGGIITWPGHSTVETPPCPTMGTYRSVHLFRNCKPKLSSSHSQLGIDNTCVVVSTFHLFFDMAISTKIMSFMFIVVTSVLNSIHLCRTSITINGMRYIFHSCHTAYCIRLDPTIDRFLEGRHCRCTRGAVQRTDKEELYDVPSVQHSQ
jgi:hypothetical protein